MNIQCCSLFILFLQIIAIGRIGQSMIGCISINYLLNGIYNPEHYLGQYVLNGSPYYPNMLGLQRPSNVLYYTFISLLTQREVLSLSHSCDGFWLKIGNSYSLLNGKMLGPFFEEYFNWEMTTNYGFNICVVNSVYILLGISLFIMIYYCRHKTAFTLMMLYGRAKYYIFTMFLTVISPNLLKNASGSNARRDWCICFGVNSLIFILCQVLFFCLIIFVCFIINFLCLDSIYSIMSSCFISFNNSTYSNLLIGIGLDNGNLGLLILTSMLFPIIIAIAGFESSLQLTIINIYSSYTFYLIFISLECIILYCFLSYNFLLYFVLFEYTVILLFYLVLIHSYSSYKVRASFYLFYFTCLGTILFTLSILLIMFNYSFYYTLYFIYYLGLMLLLVFAIKIPLWPLHYWLALVHSESSTSISLLLAGLMLKLGIFGLIRFVIPILYLSYIYLISLLVLLLAFGCIIVSSNSLLYEDVKKIIALSSVAHMNLTCSSILSLNSNGFYSAHITSISHAFSSIALFLFSGFLYIKTQSRLLDSFWFLDYFLRVVLLLLLLSNLSFPSTINFIAEFTALIAIIILDSYLLLFLFIPSIISLSLFLLLYNRKITNMSINYRLSFTLYESLILCHFIPIIYGTGLLFLL